MRPLTSRRVAMICLGLGLVLFAAVVISLRMGAYPISVRDIVITLFQGALGRWNDIPSEFWLVVFGLRLPRIALGILVGASLATSGAGFQALLRNPLADPYVLGVSSGAALGAILSLIAAPHTPGADSSGRIRRGAATIAAVYFLGRRGGQLDSATLLLGGIITASFLSAVIMFLMTTLSGARSARHGVLADGRSSDDDANSPVAVVWGVVHGICDRSRRDLHGVFRPEFDSHRRAGGAALGRERRARENRGLRRRVGADGPRSFRERRDRLRRAAGAAS